MSPAPRAGGASFIARVSATMGHQQQQQQQQRAAAVSAIT